VSAPVPSVERAVLDKSVVIATDVSPIPGVLAVVVVDQRAAGASADADRAVTAAW
jgi:hypothetical protein